MNLVQHQSKIMEALRSGARNEPLRDVAAAWTGINRVIKSVSEDHQHYQQQATTDRTGTRRREQYDELLKHIDAVYDGLRALRDDSHMRAPMGWAVADIEEEEDGSVSRYIDWLQVEDDIAGAVKFMEALRTWSAGAREEAAKAVVTRRPASPLSQTLDSLAYGMGLIFQDQTGKVPTLSNDTERTSRFEEFMVVVLECMAIRASRSSVKGAIKRLNARKSTQFRIGLDGVSSWCEPRRSGAETFGEAVKRLLNG